MAGRRVFGHGLVWQVRRDKVGHGEVRQAGLGGARWS